MSNTKLGITLMLATTFLFAMQDGISRHLAGTYNVLTVVMFRYWFFALFVIMLSAARKGGIKRVMKTKKPLLQILRGVLLAGEICVMVLAFTLLGLVESHAIFAIYPLIIAALSGYFLGEDVGWRRWLAICIGFIGVLIILRPGINAFSPEALVALTSALMFALYGLLTRYVARHDTSETSFFYTGVVGAIAITLIAPFWFSPMQTGADWAWMALLCVTGAAGHYLLIRAYEVAEASAIQPFAYFQLVFASALGVFLFSEHLEGWTVLGAGLIVSAGVFAAWRAHVRSSAQVVDADR